MLDIRLIREQPDQIKARLASRGADLSAAVDEILACDAGRRKAETQLQQLQSDRKRLSKEIGMLKAKGQDTAEIEAQVKNFASEMEQLQQSATQFDEQQREKLLFLPNLPQEDVPPGKDAADNPVIRTWGDKPPLCDFQEDHVAIGARLGLFDLERAAKISGSGFVCFTGKGARLERALINFLLDLHTQEHGYTEINPPLLIRREAMVGTGQLPKFEEEMYACPGDDLFLAPTAEVPVTNLLREEILSVADLPKKFAAHTPCFRREAGSTGRDNRGIIRVHQFDKIELVKVCAPEKSREELEALTANAEVVLQRLGLHYRVIALCTGEVGFGSAKTYDIEVWSPGQQSYLEVSSCSNFEEFQARRMHLRFKGEDGKNRFCHTLNGSGTALPRLYVALIECGLQKDGSIRLPECLHSYFGAKSIE